MRNVKIWLLAVAAAALAGCGGGSDDTLTGGGGAGGGDVPAVADVTLIASNPQLPSDASTEVTITALVRDSNNNVMSDVPVQFSADSGSVAVTQPATTDENGTATARLSTQGNQTNRTITITGSAAGRSGQVTVDVIGTEIEINGPSSLPLGSVGEYTVTLTDAGGNGIANRQVEIASSAGNGLSASTVTTNATGVATFSLTTQADGADSLTAASLGISALKIVTVSGDAFVFTAPTTGTEIPLNTPQTVTVNWLQATQPVNAGTVTFSSTRGTLSSTTATTDASGNATVSIQATNAGPATLTATNHAGTSVQLPIEFVATQPQTMVLQASPFTIPTSGQSTITAVVRDPNGNLVKNQTVSFSLDDVTGGSLSAGAAQTNSQGRAQTTYNASSTTSAVEGVHVTAQVQGTVVTASTDLTVAQRAVFISLGTGNEISEPNTAQYRKEWIVQVTDAQGRGVANVDLTLGVLSEAYYKGFRTWNGSSWETTYTAGACPDEDANRNGIFDMLEEDLNLSGELEAGNIASVSASGGAGSTVTTDANGFALIDLYWPQEYAYYLDVTLEARTTVQGTESAARQTFALDGLADDFNNENVSPPGVVSPFGTDAGC